MMKLERALAEFQERVLRKPNVDMLSRFPAVTEEKLVHYWRKFAVQIYKNWLLILSGMKDGYRYPGQNVSVKNCP